MQFRSITLVGILALLAGCRVFEVETEPSRVVEQLQEHIYAPLSEGGELTLELAQRAALSQNPDYLAAFLAVEQARMVYYQSLAAYSPQIEVGGGISQSLTRNTGLKNAPDTIVPYENYFALSTSIKGSLLLFDGFARELNMLAANRELRSVDAERCDVERILKRSTAYAYWDVLLARAGQRIAAGDLLYQLSNLNQAQSQYNSGHISKSQYLNFKIMLINSQALSVKADEAYQISIYALACLLGYPEGTLPDNITFPELVTDETSALMGIENYIGMALEKRPDLASTARMADAARLRSYGALAGYLPSISIFSETGYAPNLYNYSFYSLEHRGWDSLSFNYGAGVQWRLFDGFWRYNKYREYKALDNLLRLRLSADALRAINEVRVGVERLQTSVRLVAFYRENLEYVQEQRDLVTVEFWAGNVTITRLNEAQNELISAQSNLAIELVQMQKCVAQLAAAVNVDSSLITGR